MFQSPTSTIVKICALAALVAVGALWLRPGPAMTSGPAVQVAAGGEFSCALSYGLEVLCWGDNFRGQLGDTTVGSRNHPAPVPLGEPADMVVTGQFHACAHMMSDVVKCWGWNAYGQLGDGTTTDRYSPVQVVGLTNVAFLTAGDNHTCAVTVGGGVQCWGSNSAGQLGDGTTTNRSTPVNVSGLSSGANTVDGGAQHTCATLWAGGVKCWGDNSDGQLGDGTLVNRTTPVAVSGLSGYVLTVAAGGRHTCAAPISGPLLCWGSNFYGQVGDGTTVNRTTPVSVSALPSGAVDISAGYSHTCALTPSYSISCWGRNAHGQLGDGSTADRHAPVAVCADAACSSPLYDVFGVSGGGDHTCVMSFTGGPWCWGRNAEGQLGNGTYAQSSTPSEILGLGIISGDVNCDKRINSIDAALVLQVDAGLPVMLPMCYQHADLNHDGNINAIDAAIILQIDAGLIGVILSDEAVETRG